MSFLKYHTNHYDIKENMKHQHRQSEAKKFHQLIPGGVRLLAADTGLTRLQITSTVFSKLIPVGIWCQNDVVSTSMRRDDVASTLIRRHFTACARWDDTDSKNVLAISTKPFELLVPFQCGSSVDVPVL